jgi:hypothetical protein
MKLDTDRSKRSNAPYYSMPCAQCGDLLLAPAWAEHVNANCIRYAWTCDACGYAFENWVYLHKSVA